MTVNVLCSLLGVTYMNTINGPSNTTDFLRFFEEAYNSVNPNTGRPCLEVGDTIVMDNCPFHHNDGERILRDFLEDLNIELVFMAAYSPDFNPTEYVFNKVSLRSSLIIVDVKILLNAVTNCSLSAVLLHLLTLAYHQDCSSACRLLLIKNGNKVLLNYRNACQQHVFSFYSNTK